MKKLRMPTTDTLIYLASLLKDCRCAREVYLVIDNYQLMNCKVHRQMLGIFSMHNCPDVHMIFITQQLEEKCQITFHNANIYTIRVSAFFFDKGSTSEIFRMAGIRLPKKELDYVYARTEGWVSAIKLQIINYMETGSFDYTADIERLVENAIWNRLSPDEKEFLLIICVNESFTAPQAACMLGQELLPEGIERLIKSNDFIRYFPERGTYSIHSILLDYLRNQFYYHQSRNFQLRVLRRTGCFYAGEGQLFTAAKYFYKARDFDAVLSLPFGGEYISRMRDRDLIEFVSTIINECPDETLCKYPLVLMLFSYILLLEGKKVEIQRLCRLVESTVGNKKLKMGNGRLRMLKGEFTLLTSIMEYNDIKKINKGVKAALEMLDGPSNIMLRDMPWTFGNTSILCLYWREPGKLNELLQDMDEYTLGFIRLAGGMGAGANSALRAEAMLMRGEDKEAEIFSHKALYDARSKQQFSIGLCAELTFARIAILRGDVNGYFTAVNNIQNYGKEYPRPHILQMVDLCLTVISISLHTRDKAAAWLRDMESLEKAAYVQTVPYVQIFYSYHLLTEKRYNELFAISRTLLDAAKEMNYILPQIYHHIFIAAAKHKSGSDAEAKTHLRDAFALALADKIYLPFAQQWEDISDLLGDEIPTELKAVCKRQAAGANTIRNAIIKSRSKLTPREREVAMLARDRLSKKEIAGKLCISEQTVRTILQNVYLKLDIHSRYELNNKEF